MGKRQASSSCWKATLESRNWGRSADWEGELLKADKLDRRLGNVVGYRDMDGLLDVDRLRNGNVDGLDDMVNMDGDRRNSCCCRC